MYPMDLVRALQMANAGSGVKLSTWQLLSNFQKVLHFSWLSPPLLPFGMFDFFLVSLSISLSLSLSLSLS